MNLAVFPYKLGSKSATALAQALGVPQIKHVNSRFKGAGYKTVINWGASEVTSEVVKCKILNSVPAVRVAQNKLAFFKKMTDAPDPPRMVPWASDAKQAMKFFDHKDSLVMARQSLTGHSGQGIVLCDGSSELPPAHLYTKYIFKDSEWRVHFAFGETIDVQRKVRDPDREPTDWKVRSHRNGFIYVRNSGTPCPDDVLAQAKLAYKASGLDFGGCDVIFNKRLNKAFVLEINTAVGLEGQTVDKYRDAFLKKVKA